MTLSHVVCCVALVSDQQEPQHDADAVAKNLSRAQLHALDKLSKSHHRLSQRPLQLDHMGSQKNEGKVLRFRSSVQFGGIPVKCQSKITPARKHCATANNANYH